MHIIYAYFFQIYLNIIIKSLYFWSILRLICLYPLILHLYSTTRWYFQLKTFPVISKNIKPFFQRMWINGYGLKCLFVKSISERQYDTMYAVRNKEERYSCLHWKTICQMDG